MNNHSPVCASQNIFVISSFVSVQHQ